MEQGGAAETSTTDYSPERNMSTKSSSFRLRCSSLNSLRLRRVFDLFDKNHDGVITVGEIMQAFILLGLDSDPSESSLDSIVKSFIKKGNEGLTFEDFEALHKSLNDTFFHGDDDVEEEIGSEADHWLDNNFKKDKLAQEESDLMEAFKVFDEDGDGFISAKELQVVLDKLGLPEAKEMDRVERMISFVDRNHDGLVDFFEFKDMMRNVIVRSS
ncbi:hypothetical protein Nepgr_011906 [Nepenthes gracilis]|uniref:EF-hand domain-containing protein n=1 Tax=Nepenthes gracilis TaxID=150966 RepID=A0AAD3XMT6_NEPGR|nr:hypothetical protein Nepgr_011906 [Nepenthes gracilis]